MKTASKAKLVRIHFGENDKYKNRPLHEAVVEKCRDLGIAGATVYRGIEGYGASTHIHRAHGFGFSSDAPIVVTIVDTEAKITELLPYLEKMLHEGLLAVSEVEVIRYSKAARLAD